MHPRFDGRALTQRATPICTHIIYTPIQLYTYILYMCTSYRVASVKQELGAGGPWFVQRLSNMSTIMREWGALHAWQGLPFTSTLLACAAGTEGYSRPSSIPAVRPLQGSGFRVQGVVF